MFPTDNLGYLLHHLSAALARQSDQVLQERLGIGFSQFKILMILSWQEHVQQRMIADKLGQTEASISRQIKIMHDSGLLKTVVSPDNRREHITSLTTKGEKVTDEAMQILNDYYTPLFAQLSPKQQDNLREALIIMNDVVCQKR